MLTGPGAAGRSKRQLSLNLMLRALRAQASQLARTPISERSHNIGLGRRPLAHLTSPSVTAQAQQCNPSVAQQSCTSVKFQGCSPQASTSRSSTRHAAMALQLGTTLATPVRGPRSTLPGTRSQRQCWLFWHRHSRQPSHTVKAKRGRYEDNDDVSFDEYDNWNDTGSSSSNSITGVLGQAWGLASGTADRLVAFGMDIAPEGTSRPVVETVVRGGLTLLAITLVRSILGAALTVGSIVLAIYLFTRFNGGSSGGTGRSR